MEHLDEVRKRVESADLLKNHATNVDIVVSQADCRYLLKLVDAQAKALDKASEFTHLYENRLLDSLGDNTLGYLRNMLKP
jgi:hypothetical protein